MSFSTFLSFSSLYEIEQASILASPSVSRSNSTEYPRQPKSQHGNIVRRDSGSSTSSTSSNSSARVHFASDASSTQSSRASTPASSIYQSHSDSLHSHSKRYSTEDGSLPSSASMHFLSEEQDLSLRRFGRR
ncbi:unnamed protein product [Sympodiomycopsis kandeliae]